MEQINRFQHSWLQTGLLRKSCKKPSIKPTLFCYQPLKHIFIFQHLHT